MKRVQTHIVEFHSVGSVCCSPPVRYSSKAVFTPSLCHCHLCRYQRQVAFSQVKPLFVCGGIRFPRDPVGEVEVLLSKPLFCQKLSDLHVYNNKMTGHRVVYVCSCQCAEVAGIKDNGSPCFLTGRALEQRFIA